MQFATTYGAPRLEADCQRLAIGARTYGSIASVLKTGSIGPSRTTQRRTRPPCCTPTSVTVAVPVARKTDACPPDPGTPHRTRPDRHGRRSTSATTPSAGLPPASPMEPLPATPDITAMGFEKRLALLLDGETMERDNKRLVARLRFAALRQEAVVENVDLVGQQVSIHAPARGATMSGLMMPRRFKCFDPRPRTRGDVFSGPGGGGGAQFRSTPPHEGRHQPTREALADLAFRSMPPHEGRHRPAGGRLGGMRFDPRPRTRGDRVGARPRRVQAVSIHAPARGATMTVMTAPGFAMFRSTPPHEGRPSGCSPATSTGGFDPRPRTRGDGPHQVPESNAEVSIHAPARGATRPVDRAYARRTCFDPRPRTRGDPTRACPLDRAAVSIHTPARGATPNRYGLAFLAASFRSTPPHEGRPMPSLTDRCSS